MGIRWSNGGYQINQAIPLRKPDSCRLQPFNVKFCISILSQKDIYITWQPGIKQVEEGKKWSKRSTIWKDYRF